MALGEIGLEIDQFYYLTPREFYNLLRGYRKKEQEKEKLSWEQVRLQIYYSVLPYSKETNLTPKDILLLPWEQAQPVFGSQAEAGKGTLTNYQAQSEFGNKVETSIQTKRIRTREELEKLFRDRTSTGE